MITLRSIYDKVILQLTNLRANLANYSIFNHFTGQQGIKRKLASYETDGRLLLTTNFEVT